MKTIKLLIVIFLLDGTNVHAQTWLEKLGQKVENVAKETVERKVEQKTEEAVEPIPRLIKGAVKKRRSLRKRKKRKRIRLKMRQASPKKISLQVILSSKVLPNMILCLVINYFITKILVRMQLAIFLLIGHQTVVVK